MLELKNSLNCQWDLVALGEILLRFDPGEARIQNSRQFTVWDGGAEYNVAANVAKVFNRRSLIVTALADNALGHLAANLAHASRVDTSHIFWRKADENRNGLYFIERGFGLRPPASTFDRSHTAISRLKKGDVDWTDILAKGVRWFHTGGVFTGLSETAPAVAAEAMQAAKYAGAILSYDLNYRHSLWGSRGGRDAANAINRELLPFADVVFGTFGFDSKLSNYSEPAFRTAAEKMRADFPNLKMIVSSLRETHSASRHDLGGACLAGDEVFRAKDHTNMEVLDRVGSGDAFAAGFIASLLDGKDIQFAMDCASAHGSLAMTTPGDVSMSTMDEVLALISGRDSTAKR